ncbi:hypothetical protein PQS90_18150 [Pseudomonas sp. BLCC-B13]|uniref:hypothetical protein n=1 Tax=Pseudomonas sp. BLCC-B13 TaxID=3025314 RepID=UPI00234EEFC8|nr:hypothetical protein [Pseudomonas sp. BLCC-B13]MDC7827081.1 hypothetical protein [Pseudomonas sp. BLCC-B13]
MLFLLGFLLLAVFCLSVLIRAFLLFPLRALRHGWAPALRRYGLSLLLCVAVLLWELGALYGFSWQQLGRADRGQMVDAAVAFAYPEAYADLDELRNDYAHFRPEVLYWGSRNDQIIDVADKLLGRTEYQIRLPDLVVVADIHGQPLYHFPLDEEQQVIPDRPILGLIGDIQDLREAAPVNETLGLRWSNPQYGEAEIHDNCFSALSPLSREQHLELTSSGAEPLRMGRPLGYYRVQVQLGQWDGRPSNSATSRQRISRAEFLRERQACRARAAASVSAPRE